MKKFIYKNISVVLSLTLVLGVLFPCLSGFGASAYTAENQAKKTQFDTAVQTLLTAWGNMDEDTSAFTYPYKWVDDSSTTQVSVLTDAADPTGVSLGGKTADITVADTSAGDGKAKVVYAFNLNLNQISAFTIGDIEDICFWLKTDKDINARFYFNSPSYDEPYNNFTLNSEIKSFKNGYSYSASASADWQKVSIREMLGEEAFLAWRSAHATGAFIRFNADFALASEGDAATVTLGGARFDYKDAVELPEGVENLSPYELLSEAEGFDISGLNNTAEFTSAKQSLATLLANAFDPTELKTAWGKINRLAMTDYLYPYGMINTDTDKTDGSYEDAIYFREGVEGVTTTYNLNEDKYLFGEKSATFDFALCKNRTAISTGDNQNTVYLSVDADTVAEDELADNFGTVRNLYGADDLQFSFVVNKINTAATGAKLGFRITGTYGTFGVRKSSISYDINEDMVGEVITVKFSDLAESAGMPNWKQAFTTEGGTIARIELQLFDDDSENNIAVNMTVGTVVSILYNDVPTDSETESWNISDWVYAAKSLDLTGYHETEDFLAALSSAEEIREISGIEKSSAVTTYNELASADVSGFGENLLAGITPEINYYDGVSENKTAMFTVNYEKFADGNIFIGDTITGADFSNSGSFVEFIYDLKKINAIDKVAVASVSNSALRNYKYKLYGARTEGELFTADSLLLTYVNRDGSAAQIIDYSGEPQVTARYIALRIYTPACDMSAFDNTVRLNELGVWGYSKDYSLEGMEFSASRIESLGNNILANGDVKPFVRANTGNRQKFTGLFDAEKYPLTNVFDKDVNTAIAVSGNYRMRYASDTTSLHIYFDLGKAYSINKFMLSSMNAVYNEIGKYKVHASNDLNQLFTQNSVVAEHDNTVNTSKMQIITMKTDVVARYVSFHITLAVSDYEALIAKHGKGYEGAAIRISELGVFGEEYERVPVKQNVLAHVPVEINRVDGDGNKVAIGETEYSATGHKLTYDGDYGTAVTVASNGNKIEYLYSLYDDSDIEALRVVTESESVSEIKFYTSTAKSAIDNDASLVYSYNKTTDGAKTIFSKTFVDAPIKASFIKIVVTVSGDFDPTEIEAIGWDSGRGVYENLALNNSSYTRFYLVDTATKEYESSSAYFDVWLPGWSYWSDYHDYPYALDGDLGTIYAYFGGVNNSQSINIYLNLQTISCVDNVSVYTGMLEDYRPSKMNLYMGNSIEELFAADAVPVKQWTEKVPDATGYSGSVSNDEETEGEDVFDPEGEGDIEVDFGTGDFVSGDLSSGEETEQTYTYAEKYGLYEADFIAQKATCIRLEIVESNPTYFAHKNKVGGIISEIMVNGFELSGSAASAVVDAANDMTMRAFDPTAYNDFTAGTVEAPTPMGSYMGEPIVSVDGIGDNVAYSTCTSTYGYVEFTSTSDMTADVTLADVEDIYFSYKVNNAYSEGSAAARIYIYDQNGKIANSFASTGTGTVLFIPVSNTEWVNTSMRAVTGENWKDAVVDSFNTVYGNSEENALTQADISISKIRFGFNQAAQADMSFSSLYYEFNEGCNPYANNITHNLGENNQEPALSPSAYYSDARYTPEILSGEHTSQYVSLKGIGSEICNVPCAAGAGYVEWATTTAASDKTLADVQDIYFSYKVDNAISPLGSVANARIYIYDQNGTIANTFASTGTSTVVALPLANTEWTETSIREIAGGNWKELLIESFSTAHGEELSADEISISQIRLGFNDAGAGDISFSSMYYEYNDISSASIASANRVLSSARGLIDPTTATKESAREFKYTVGVLAELLGAEPVSEYCISGDYQRTQVALKDVALLAQYLDGTLGNDDYIDLNCADVNNDGKITEADLIALRKMLFG
ncbi:MAG: discoidin domain-containing protein [Clostridia bacterium]|nr:discoidin domain-containing protein [Clostridia bacterium]